MKELKFEELSTQQKLGMTLTAFLNDDDRTPEEDDFIINLIKNHSLGAVWITHGRQGSDELVKRVRKAADYPILIFTDAESGFKPYVVGKHSAIGSTGSEEHAYAFGKAVGVMGRKKGYNIVCNPILDMRAGSQRSLGEDKEMVAKIAAAIARGMHDGGVLCVAKHYPGANSIGGVDSHMGQSVAAETKAQLLSYNLYPYLHLMKEGLLDGIMTSHRVLPEIDPEYPTSLSKKVGDVIRDEGFNGISITDALCMMGIRAHFNNVEAKGLAIAAGNDTILPFTANNSVLYDELCRAYDEGYISDDRLDEAVKRILEAQHKIMMLPQDSSLSDKEIHLLETVSKDGVYARADEGVPVNISRDGKHYFVIMSKCEIGIEAAGQVAVDTFSGGWHEPFEIEKKLKELFPNSTVDFINEFPTSMQNFRILKESIGCDELVFLTFSEALAYVGKERLTHRFVTLIEAMQITGRVSTIVHFGNALVLEELPHIPRYIIGANSKASVHACLDVLAGNYPAKGVPTYKINFK